MQKQRYGIGELLNSRFAVPTFKGLRFQRQIEPRVALAPINNYFSPQII